MCDAMPFQVSCYREQKASMAKWDIARNEPRKVVPIAPAARRATGTEMAGGAASRAYLN